jgi:protein-arginine kinase
VYKRLVTAVNEVEKNLPFSHHDRLGFLTFCPTNLGTTIRASVHIQLPKLAADKSKLEEVAGKYNLQVITFLIKFTYRYMLCFVVYNIYGILNYTILYHDYVIHPLVKILYRGASRIFFRGGG